MQTTKPGMTKRQALLALLGAAPILAYGNQVDLKTSGFRIDASTSSDISLLQLDLIVTEANRPDALFLKVTVNGKEEVRISLDEALQILKDDGGNKP